MDSVELRQRILKFFWENKDQKKRWRDVRDHVCKLALERDEKKDEKGKGVEAKLTKVLDDLVMEDLLKKEPKGHKKVFYSITPLGKRAYNYSYLESFVRVAIRHVRLMAPENATPEDMVNLLRDFLDREDVAKMAHGLKEQKIKIARAHLYELLDYVPP